MRLLHRRGAYEDEMNADRLPLLAFTIVSLPSHLPQASSYSSLCSLFGSISALHSTWCALAGKYNPLPGDGDSPRFNGTQNACSALDNESFISLQEEIQKYVKCRNGELGGETCKTIYSSENNVTCSEGLSQKLER